MGFSDSGYLITIGADLSEVFGTVFLVGVIVAFLRWQYCLAWIWVAGIFFGAGGFLLVLHTGDRIVFGPEYVRETVRFREVGRVEWRHVRDARLEMRGVFVDGEPWQDMHLVLLLKTGDEWTLDVNGLKKERQMRLLAFAKERVARR